MKFQTSPSQRPGAVFVGVPGGVLALLLTLSPGAHAASDGELSAGRASLSAAELVADVVSGNPHLEALQHAVEGARKRVGPAGALDDPMLTYALAPNSLGVDGLDPGHIVGLAQPIPWPGKLSTREQRAKHAVEASEAAYEKVRREAIWTARSLFADWAYVYAALEVNSSQQRLLDDLISSSEGQYVAGAGGQHAVLAAELKRAQRQRERIALEARRDSLAARINALRNKAIETEVASPADFPVLSALPTYRELRERLLARHPGLQQMDAQIKGASADRKLARLNDWPDLRFTATWLGTLPRDENRAQVGLMLNLPFGRDKRRDAQAAAAARVEELGAMRRDYVAQLESSLRTAVTHAEAATSTLNLYHDRLLPLAEQSLLTAQSEYAAANGSAREVIEAENDLLDVRLGVAAVRRDQFREYARIALMTGNALNFQLVPGGGLPMETKK